MTVSTDLFRQHARQWRTNRYVYPVVSRRSRGLSIGINLNPGKNCTFDCLYCSVDRSELVPAQVDLAVLAAEIEAMVEFAASGRIWQEDPFCTAPEPLRRLNDLAFSGDGEPTSSPIFPAACRLAVEALERRGLSGVKVVVITNATLLQVPGVAETFAFLDAHGGEVWAKLDAGTEALYRRVNRSQVGFAQVLDNLLAASRVRPLVIQSLFMRLPEGPPSEAELDAWAGRLRALLEGGGHIARVQVYTLARKTADPTVAALDDRALEAIAARAAALGLPVETFGAPA